MSDQKQGHVDSGSGGDIFAQTLRTVAVLVGATVLFVGALSLAAVFITSKAVGPASHSATSSPVTDNAAAPKKPLSI